MVVGGMVTRQSRVDAWVLYCIPLRRDGCAVGMIHSDTLLTIPKLQGWSRSELGRVAGFLPGHV